MSALSIQLVCDDAMASEAVEVRAVDITERLSAPFRVVVRFAAADGHDVETIARELVGTTAHLTIEGERIHGVIADVISESRELGKPARYRARIVPRLSTLSMSRRARVFSDRDVPEIVRLVLADNGLTEGDGDLELHLSGRYDKREIVVQYDETDLAFISRLLEHEGIAYHFVHGEDRERIVLTDSNNAFARREPYQNLPYTGLAFRAGMDPSVFTAECERQMVPGEIALLDYDWRKPAVPLIARATVDRRGIGARISVREHFVEPARGAQLAATRADEARFARERFRITTNVSGVHAGDVLSLQGHPVHEWDREYLVCEVHHAVSLDTSGVVHRNDLLAIDAAVPYRPARVTPAPRIEGVLYATVDGLSSGAAAPIDDQGRYRVILPFDVDENENQRSRVWVRRMQPLAGSLAGMHFPLLPGTEVLLAFVDGDCDRPVIMGAVPNALTVSPVTRANATQSIVRSTTGITILLDDGVPKLSD